MDPRKIVVSCTTVPAANESVVCIDSTYGLISGSQASMNASTGAYLTPGAYRAMWAHAVVKVTIKCTTQNITAVDEILTGLAGTSADWETQGAAGSHTIVAGTTSVWEFKPLEADFRIRYTAGGTPPGAVTVKVQITFPTTDYGN